MKHLLYIAFLISTSSAFAQSNSVQLKMGTTGLGFGYQKQIKPKLAATIALSYMNVSPSILLKGSSMQHRLKGNAKFLNLELAAKWYPKAKETNYGDISSGSFYFKGGLNFRDKSDYVLYSDYQQIKSGNQFDVTDPKTGRLNFFLETNPIQPFVMLGFQLFNNDSNWKLEIEGGLSYHGTAESTPFVNIFETGSIKLYEPNFNKWVRVPKIIRLVKVYPLLNFTIGRRF